MANGHRYIQKIVKNGKTRYFYTMEELAAYRKALSSRDEENRLLKATDTKNLKNWTNGKPASRSTKLVNAQLRAYHSDDKKKTAALKDWQEATTVKGKAKAVSEVYKKYNPKTAKKIEKGKKQIAKLLNKKKKA